MIMAAFTLSLDMPAFDAFKRRALAQAEVLVPVATQALVGRAGASISARLQGVSAIRRIDTTRLIGSYETATSEIAATPVVHGSAVEAEDVVAQTVDAGLRTTYQIGSAAPYAEYIEYGTQSIRAGLHVLGAANDAARAAQATCEPILRKALE